MDFTEGHIDQELKRLRNIYLDENLRNQHEWTKREKGMIHLDWFRNPELYYEWTPAETDDLLYMHRTTLMFGYSHLAITNTPHIPIFCKLLPITIPHAENGYWQAAITLQLNNDNHIQIYTHLLRKPACLNDSVHNNSKIPSQSRLEKQILSSPIDHSSSGACALSKNSNYTLTGFKWLQDDCSPHPRFLLASTSIEQLILYDITEFIMYHLQSLVSTYHSLVDLSSHTILSNECINFFSPEFQQIVKFDLDSPSIPFTIISKNASHYHQLDSAYNARPRVTFHVGSDIRFQSKSRHTKINQTQLCFAYTRFYSQKKILPTHIGVLLRNELKDHPSGELIVFDISKYTEIGQINQNNSYTVLRGIFPPECYPTSVSSIPGQYKLNDNKLPHFVTCDEGGYIRIWKIGDNTGICYAAHRVDVSPLTCVAVNQKIPSILAFGTESGFIKFYDLSRLLSTLPRLKNNPPLMPLPPPSFGNLYEYQKHRHPVIRINWVGNTFLAAHYSEPSYNRESTNGGVIAIWNPSKQEAYFDENTILQSKYWMIHRGPQSEQEPSLHAWASLVALHGGHINSADGALSSDFIFSQIDGLSCLSSDESGQIHFYKPNFFFFSDCDDLIEYNRVLKSVKTACCDIDLSETRQNPPTQDTKMEVRIENITTRPNSNNDKGFNSLQNFPLECLKQFKIVSHVRKIIEKAKKEREQSSLLQLQLEAFHILWGLETLNVFQESHK